MAVHWIRGLLCLFLQAAMRRDWIVTTLHQYKSRKAFRCWKWRGLVVLCTQREQDVKKGLPISSLKHLAKSSEVSIIFSPCCLSVTTIVSPPLHSLMLKCINVMISGVGVNDHSVPLNENLHISKSTFIFHNHFYQDFFVWSIVLFQCICIQLSIERN